MSDAERWAAYARVILERVKVNGEPALDFIDRILISIPTGPPQDPTDRSE